MLFIALAVCSIAMLATSCACSNNQEQTEETATLESIDLSSYSDEVKEAFESAKSQLEEGVNEETMEELLEKLKEAGLNEEDVAEFAEVAKAKAEELASKVEDLDAEQLAEEAEKLAEETQKQAEELASKLEEVDAEELAEEAAEKAEELAEAAAEKAEEAADLLKSLF